MFISPSSSSSLPPSGEPSSSRAWLWALGGSLAVGAVIAILLLRYRGGEDLLNTALVPSPRATPAEVVEEEGVREAPILLPDADGDGLSDEEEARLGTNPRSHDTDGDGISDREEAMIFKTDPKVPNLNPLVHPMDRAREQGGEVTPSVNP